MISFRRIEDKGLQIEMKKPHHAYYSYLESTAVLIIYGKTAQIPCFSKKYNHWTAETSHVFAEQQFFNNFPGAAQTKNL